MKKNCFITNGKIFFVKFAFLKSSQFHYLWKRNSPFFPLTSGKNLPFLETNIIITNETALLSISLCVLTFHSATYLLK